MTSGIRGLRRLEAVDSDGARVGVLVGWTSDGRIAIGVTSGEDSQIALLDGDSIGDLFRYVRAAVVEAAT